MICKAGLEDLRYLQRRLHKKDVDKYSDAYLKYFNTVQVEEIYWLFIHPF